jgi:predicted glycoside hydrolase/deacetylase ChbG (UPF0249 family)
VSIKLIVNADDYGKTAGVSAGIRDSHKRGIVTSTTTMMNMPDAEHALRQAATECPKLGLGVHLVLTTGTALLPAERVPSLLDPQCRFFGEEATIERLDAINPHELEAEWRTQIDRFISILGRAPDHLDSHHHVSFFAPPLFEVMLKLAQDYDCAIRLPAGESQEVLDGYPKVTASAALEEYAALLQKYQPLHPDRFIAKFYDEGVSQDALTGIINSLGDGVTEVMCHPAHVDDELSKVSIYAEKRGVEFGILTQPALLNLIKARHIELVTFGQLC